MYIYTIQYNMLGGSANYVLVPTSAFEKLELKQVNYL